MIELRKVSPLVLLEQSSKQSLGRGEMGVLIARAGVGKTACLINMALDKLLQGEKLVHISLEEGPEKISGYYDVIYAELLRALGLPDDPDRRALMQHNRLLLAYLKQSFEPARLRRSLENLATQADFRPDTIILEGLRFEKTERRLLEELARVAVDYNVQLWFSALSHRHITETNERGIPFPCHLVDDFFSLILQLYPDSSGLSLRLLKDRDRPLAESPQVRLDPGTFLVLES